MSSKRERVSSVTGKKSFQVILELGKDSTGKRKQEYRTFHEEKEADMFLHEKEIELYNGTYVGRNSISVKKVAQSWLGSIKENRLKYNTIRGYTVNVEKHIVSNIGNIPIQKLKSSDIKRLITNMQKEGLASATIKYAMLNLRQILDYAVEHHLLKNSPFVGIKIPANRKTKIQPYTVDELRTLLQVSKGTPLEFILQIEVGTGLRIGEILALKWSDVDFERSQISVNGTVVYKKGEGCVIDTPKSYSSFRTIPIHSSLMNTLKKLKSEESKRLATLSKKKCLDDITIIHNKKWGLRIPSKVSSDFSKLLEKNNLRHIRFHDLRKTHASILALNYGMSPYAIRDRLGHSRVSTTIDCYISGTAKQQIDGLSMLAFDISNDVNEKTTA